MIANRTESLLYGGESPKNWITVQRYLLDVQRGKSLLQLKAMADELTPEIRRQWSPRTFTPIHTSESVFDEVVCNISFHFHKHGQVYVTARRMTDAALRYFREHRSESVKREKDGLLQFPDGSLFEVDGRIVTFVS
jgi:hypothetical protein